MTTPQDPFSTPPASYGPSPSPSYGAEPRGVPSYDPPPSDTYGAGAGRPPYAGWWRRIGSALVDGLLILLAALPFLILAGGKGELDTAEDGSLRGGVFTALAYLAGLAFAVYNLVRQGRTGRTFGKSAVGTRLVKDADGTPVGAGRSILRWVLHVVDQIPLYLGYLWPLWDRKKQTFADKIVSTVVVRG